MDHQALMPLFGCTAADLFGDDIAEQARLLAASTGFYALKSPGFWERWVATQLGGEPTEAKSRFDVRVTIWGAERTAEVKFSQAFQCAYTRLRGKDYSRRNLKWLLSHRQIGAYSADGVILIGLDADLIYSWVLPRGCAAARRSITITAPSSRLSGLRGRLDDYNVPPTELLPAFARAVCL